MAIFNEIFDSYREDQRKIKEAVELLKKNNYAVYSPDEMKELESRYNELQRRS